ncbi:MAG: DUF2059 domain-containing protein [Candidatus Coatesbacteria bacterium]|nr:DUF2059 domain-containing protein [Candidatus Coatesbacteria bacterium]
MKFRIIILLLLVSFSLKVFAEESSEDKTKDIRLLLELTGAEENSKQAIQNLINIMKKTAPAISDEYWKNFMKNLKTDVMINLLVPVYDKYFTHEDIKGMIEFYKTPLGKKIVSVQPSLTKDAMEIGQKWGIQISQQIMKDIQEKNKREE